MNDNEFGYSIKCRCCFYFNDGKSCNSPSRLSPKRFPFFIRPFLKKDKDGRLQLPYDNRGNCGYYLASKLPSEREKNKRTYKNFDGLFFTVADNNEHVWETVFNEKVFVKDPSQYEHLILPPFYI